MPTAAALAPPGLELCLSAPPHFCMAGPFNWLVTAAVLLQVLCQLHADSAAAPVHQQTDQPRSPGHYSIRQRKDRPKHRYTLLSAMSCTVRRQPNQLSA
jgi:hypothetical protein